MKDLLDSKSTASMTRLMSLMCIICACGLACYGVYAGRDLVGLAALCSAFITPAFAAKVVQKHIEMRDNG